MPTTTTSSIADIFDGRDLPCESKRPAFLARCVELPVGRSFIFLNGHDPVPLRQHLDKLYPGCFQWDFLPETEAGIVRLSVTKRQAPAGGFESKAAEIRCH